MEITLDIKIIPQARRQKIEVDGAGNIKVYVVSAAQRGRANRELIELIAARGNVSKSNIVLMHGFTTRLKRIKIISTATKEEFLKRLYNQE